MSAPDGLVVGVTGHRPHRLRHDQHERLAEQASELFAGLAALHGEAGPTAEPPCLLSALAEGADRQLAQLALDAGYALHALLPFRHADYLADFSGAASLREFERLLGGASRVIELPGRRAAPAAAYHALGAALLDAADLLCAVWDGEPALGPGGTAEVVAQALARGCPVVHLSSRADAPAALLCADGGVASWLRGPAGQAALRARLQDCGAGRRA